jgi:hypothetical protein
LRWRKLRLDIGYRNEPTDTDIEAVHNWEIKVQVLHREVVAIDEIVVEKLVTEQAVSGRINDSRRLYGREAKAPIKVIVLDGVRQTLDINDGLVKLNCVGGIVVPDWSVSARLDRIGADIAAYFDPTNAATNG